MNLALFDFDGTISFGDTWTPFIRFALSPTRRAVGVARLSPWIAGYKLGVVSASAGRRATARVVFRGQPEVEVRARGERYAREMLPQGMRPEALDRIAWHRAEGDTIVVVSASLDVYLSPWCRQHGLELICSELEASRGVMTGRYVGRDCIGPEKARRVRERFALEQYPVIYAYGDTEDDLDMLALAHRRFFRWQEATAR
jgi:phosphatidylglycerophosphatase C